jgi:sugar phosphate permease
MVSYFIGGSFGSWIAAQAWGIAGWTGVCIVGVTFALLGIGSHLLLGNKNRLANETTGKNIQ